uniref:Uncharacterized protein n=1 Tax=Nelumbo nucifera TaxID=4432 RepID=A0A822XGK5_NELNU|nr:TPA_asm: hypothetical protein HUJ06_020266 [Nelumbo nucifera]
MIIFDQSRNSNIKTTISSSCNSVSNAPNLYKLLQLKKRSAHSYPVIFMVFNLGNATVLSTPGKYYQVHDFPNGIDNLTHGCTFNYLLLILQVPKL